MRWMTLQRRSTNSTNSHMGDIYTATYSPEDNKLRLYAAMRLSRPDYERVRAAGFIWAPKQELFVAPAWTPEREDLLLEFAEEIEDEDKSLVDRAAERAERFEEYSESRMEDAERARQVVTSITDGIPMGQPILVGHHSEKHARRDAERIENGMRKAVKMWETSKYWMQRAQGAIGNAKYKEEPAVRARRIKKIEADERKTAANVKAYESGKRFWTGGCNIVNRETGEKRPLAICEENRAKILKCVNGVANVPCLPSLHGSHWSAFDVLRPDGERYASCPAWTVAQVQEKALEHYAQVIARANRWLAHYANRLAYERAMLAADGGTVADKTGPEKGGACRCWASPSGGWSYIQKVNKVSVTVLDNWGNGGGNFTRVIPFDKLTAVMTAAEVQAARDEGRLVESSDKVGFGLCRHKTSEEPKPFRDNWAQKAHEEALKRKADDDEAFRSLREASKAGVQVVTAPQLFPTPPELAERLVEIADIQPGNRVLEPSAGTGSIASKIVTKTLGTLLCVEINRTLSDGLDKLGYVVENKDFLQCNGDLGMFDRIVMNPPFTHGSDVKHILHAAGFLKPGGRLVSLCAAGPRQAEALKPLGKWIDLPEGSFAEQGTNVRVAIVVIDA